MKQELDVSELPPPEPLEKILNSLKTLQKGDYLVVYHRRKPQLLYPKLKELSFVVSTEPHGDGYHILIWHDSDSAPV